MPAIVLDSMDQTISSLTWEEVNAVKVALKKMSAHPINIECEDPNDEFWTVTCTIYGHINRQRDD